MRAERTACGYGYTDGVPGYGLGLLPYYFGQQPAAQQVAGCGRRRMVEQLPADTQRRCGGDIGRAVIDKERLRRIESVAAEQSPVDFRLGFTTPSSQETTSPSKSP